MKIIYLTDIHDGLHGMKEIFLQTDADLYLLSGDIIYKAFFSFDRIIDFCTCQEELDILAKQGGEDTTPYDYATHVIRFPSKYSDEIQNKSARYRVLFNLAAKTMKEKYKLIYSLILKYAKSRCVLLPGNYDIDLQYTELYELDTHRKSFQFQDIRFAGYGGAPVVTSGIPEKLAVKFHEYNKNGQSYSEPEDFLKEEKPDVAIIHNPAYGYLDKIPGFGHIGSQGIRRYIDDCPPILAVSGHVHEDQGLIKKGKTIFLNPSNFGPVDSVHGFQAGGFYAEIFIEEKKVTRINLCRLEEKKVGELIRVNTSGNSLLVEEVSPNSCVSPEEFVRN
ncbi:MAG: metallophosphoesterase [Leptospiraceae bacterium]|nr:metallophosphoesterase [Leptospiraceae bacterium]